MGKSFSLAALPACPGRQGAMSHNHSATAIGATLKWRSIIVFHGPIFRIPQAL
jgi:hypothetical protein